jgi:hypothetical protein
MSFEPKFDFVNPHTSLEKQYQQQGQISPFTQFRNIGIVCGQCNTTFGSVRLSKEFKLGSIQGTCKQCEDRKNRPITTNSHFGDDVMDIDMK